MGSGLMIVPCWRSWPQRAPVSQAAWREKPTFMVVAAKDAIIPPQMERDQVKAAKATAIEVPSSHVAMLSFPKEVAELIIKAAE